MKKNTMMRLASFLLIAVLISTSAISGTYAKYVTEGSASDTARVAKWGIDVSVGGNLFGKYYAANTDANGDQIVASSTNVASGDGSNVVAPGTKNDAGFEVKITGTPEVAYTIAAKTGDAVTGAAANEEIFLGVGEWGTMVAVAGLNNATDFAAGDYYTLSGTDFTKATAYASGTQYYELHDYVKVSTNPYYPIKWSLKKDNVADTTNTRLSDIAAAIKAGVEAKSNVANQAADINYVLTWVWDFGTADITDTDRMDTILGNLKAEDPINIVAMNSGSGYTSYTALEDGKDYNLDVKFAFEVTVTQVN